MNNIIFYIPIIILIVIALIYTITKFYSHNKETYNYKNNYKDSVSESFEDSSLNVLLADSNGNLSVRALGNMDNVSTAGTITATGNISTTGNITATGTITATENISTNGTITATGNISTNGSLTIGNWKITSDANDGLVFTNNKNNKNFKIGNDGVSSGTQTEGPAINAQYTLYLAGADVYQPFWNIADLGYDSKNLLILFTYNNGYLLSYYQYIPNITSRYINIICQASTTDLLTKIANDGTILLCNNTKSNMTNFRWYITILGNLNSTFLDSNGKPI